MSYQSTHLLQGATSEQVEGKDNSRIPGDEDVLEEFPFDVDKIVTYYWGLSKLRAVVGSCFPFFGCLCCPCIWGNLLCCQKQNIIDVATAQRLYVTRDHITYKVAAHDTGFRCECQRVGARFQTVPFDRIQDILLKEPAGGCCVREILTTVEVQTAGTTIIVPNKHGGSVQTAELAPIGLVDAHRFREVCLGLKKGVYRPRDGQGAPVMVNSSAALGAKHDGLSGAPFVPIAQPVPGALSMGMAGGAEAKETTQLLQQLNSTMSSVDASLKVLVQQQQQIIAHQQQQQQHHHVGASAAAGASTSL